MTRERNLSPPPEDRKRKESTGSPDWESATERELDEALARAASLARELGQDVASDDSGQRPPAPAEGAPIFPHDADAEMAELDRLLAETKAELGSNQPTAEPRDPKGSLAPVPDFMAEFMEDAPARESNAVREPARSQFQPMTAALAPAKVASPAPTAAPRPSVTGELEALPTGRGTKRGLADRIRPAAVKICETGVRTLEALDAPTAGVGPRIRQILGWVGLLLLATAVVVLVFARK